MSENVDFQVPLGFRASAVRAGIKPSGLPDLALFVADSECHAAGLFTTNLIAAAPVKWDKAIVPSDRVRAVLVNAGNANAATGEKGFENVRIAAAKVAAAIGCKPEQVLVASTGVIGRQLPMENLLGGVEEAYKRLSDAPESFRASSRAIMTTDTKPKVAYREIKTLGGPVRLLGLAKGAAMMGPRMATMLAFLFTDAIVDSWSLQEILKEAVEDSFHCISVEGHTSTNDTVLLVSSNKGGALSNPEKREFSEAVKDVCRTLARMIPEDGEGASHLITIDVLGCAKRSDAHKIAKTVAESALVKTAVAGADPNWGRIVSAAGYAGVPFSESELSLVLNGFPLFESGGPVDFDEAEVSASIKANRETTIKLSLEQGSESIKFWTCDLTVDYVHINADYTT